MKEKIKRLLRELNNGLIDKEEVIKISLLTMLAQENLILIGPPGTAKSEIARRLSGIIKDQKEDNYFEYLLTKFTTPEEIFGPLSIKELKEDRFKRNSEGYMPRADIVFLDEIFKANSSILNTLLTILNERVFHNGNKREKAPLLSLISASNELPDNDNELNALYDRILVRLVVGYISDDKIDDLFQMDNSEFEISDDLKLTTDEIKSIRKESRKVVIPDCIREAIKSIRIDFKDKFKEDDRESISDRRLVKVQGVLKVSAYTNGRDFVDFSDLMILRHCLWNSESNREDVGRIVVNNIKKYFNLSFKSNELSGLKDDESQEKKVI